ncbi:MAG: hypothetical protein WBF83_08215 [Moheibacter sp.]
MKSVLFFFMIFFLCNYSLAQSKKLTDDDYSHSSLSELDFAKNAEEAYQLSVEDIKRGIPFILIQGGIAPVRYPSDEEFENRFGVYYFEEGCVVSDFKLTKAYNSAVFDHLDKNFGKSWRAKVRNNAIGFKEWKNEKQNSEKNLPLIN